MGTTPWKRCLERLEGELSPQQFNTWIRPLHAIEENGTIQLLAPNRFVLDWVSEKYLSRMEELLSSTTDNNELISLNLEIGSKSNITANNNKKAPSEQFSSTEKPKQQSSQPRQTNRRNRDCGLEDPLLTGQHENVNDEAMEEAALLFSSVVCES